MTNKQPLVSIIIPTKNCDLSLKRLLNSITIQKYAEYEVIVVDNNSTDNTKSVARKFGAKVFNKGPERGAQKNLGAKEATGEYLFFVDSDMELEKGVISECLQLVKKQYDGVIVPERSIGKGFWNECIILERRCYVDDTDMTAARFMSKATFNSLKGFDENLVASGDDMDLSQRLRKMNGKIGRTKSFINHYEGHRTPWSTVKKWRYYGRDMHKYYLKNPTETVMQYLPIRRAWMRHWRLLAQDPVHTVGFMYLKVCNFIGVMWGQIDIRLGIVKENKIDPYKTK